MKLSILLLLISFNALAAPTGITWVAPTERTDSTLLNGDLAGFKVYYGAASGVYTTNVVIQDPLATAYTLDLGYGDHYAVVTAYDTEGRESAISKEVFKNIPWAPPKQVTGVSWAVSP